jgi:hypothetical protein
VSDLALSFFSLGHEALILLPQATQPLPGVLKTALNFFEGQSGRVGFGWHNTSPS